MSKENKKQPLGLDLDMDESQMSMEALQDLARAGKIRWRSFGDEGTYGYSMRHNGDLDAAADDLPRVLQTGLCRLYYDDVGVFIGPINPKYVAEDMFLPNDDIENASDSGGHLQ